MIFTGATGFVSFSPMTPISCCFMPAPSVVKVGELSDAVTAGAAESSLFQQWPIVGNNAIKRLANAIKTAKVFPVA